MLRIMAITRKRHVKKARSRVQFPPTWDNVLVVKFSAQQLHRVEHELKREVANFEHTQVGLGIAHLETEPVLFVFKPPVTEIQLSVTLNFNFKFVTAAMNQPDQSLHE